MVIAIRKNGKIDVDLFSEELMIESDQAGTYCYNVNTGEPVELELSEKEAVKMIRDMMRDADEDDELDSEFARMWHAVEYITDARINGVNYEWQVRMFEDGDNCGVIGKNGIPALECSDPKVFEDIYDCLDFAISTTDDMQSREYNGYMDFAIEGTSIIEEE